MGDGGDSELGVEAYAAILAALTDPAEDRAAVLAMHGLDEDRWDAIDTVWQERLSRAADDTGAAEGANDAEDAPPPPLVVRFAEAFSRAQRARVEGLLPFERYVEVTRALRRGVAIAEALDRLRVSLPAYLKAHEHWMRAMGEDPALAERFSRALG